MHQGETCQRPHALKEMPNKISHARSDELEHKRQRKDVVESKIRGLQAEIQAIKDKMSSAASTSEGGRQLANQTVMGGDEKLIMLQIAINKLRNDKSVLENEISFLKGRR